MGYYHEDSNAQADVNIVMNENFDLIEFRELLRTNLFLK